MDFSNYRRSFNLVVLFYYGRIVVFNSQRGNHVDDCLLEFPEIVIQKQI